MSPYEGESIVTPGRPASLHDTVKEKPAERLLREQPSLHPYKPAITLSELPSKDTLNIDYDTTPLHHQLAIYDQFTEAL